LHNPKFAQNKIRAARFRALCLLLLVGSLAFAQRKAAFSHRIGDDTQRGGHFTLSENPRTSVRILAVLVDFQQDNDPLTTGDGKFQLQPSPAPLIDPPPHDSAYFKNKLLFVENYFKKSSKGALTVSGDVVGERVTLSNSMAFYSPSPATQDNRKLADLAAESWRKVDSLYPGIDFSQYDAFVIFHAGVGRDVDLVSLVGENPALHDIPSLTLDSAALASALGQPTFPGFAVDSSRFFIKNAIILPETETRILSTGAGDDTIQLGINGLFAASIGSYLGLPDLFDTKTGRSGIGQFGLMDGASIFAYSGLFPPEPSAWEKITLGWTVPILIRNSASNIPVPAVGLSQSHPDTIYKIPISASEYFLVENRNRDPQGDGQRIEVITSTGDSLWRYFGTDTAGFSFYDVSGIAGSVVDVQDFDWAIIGATDGSVTYSGGGGILIWHIDDNIIGANRSTNTINADINHRGVYLEEADGSQDIGQSYEFLTPGYGTEYGDALDCWFSGNTAAYYKNTFTVNSFPNSNSNSGTASLITIKDFTARSPRMTMDVEIGNSNIHRLAGFSLSGEAAGRAGQPTASDSCVSLTIGDAVYLWGPDGKSRTADTTGLLSIAGGRLGVAIQDSSASVSIIAGAQDSMAYIWRLDLSNHSSGPVGTVPLGRRATTPPSFVSLPEDAVLFGCEDGTVQEVNVNTLARVSRSFGSSSGASIAQLPSATVAGARDYYVAAGGTLYGRSASIRFPDSSYAWDLAAATSLSGDFIAAAEVGGKRVLAVDGNLTGVKFDIVLDVDSITAISTGDIDRDGEKDIVLSAGNKIIALNRNGVTLDHFPIRLAPGRSFTGTPLIGDFNNDGIVEIASAASNGSFHVFGSNGRELDGFPIQVSSPGITSAATFKTMSGNVGFFFAGNSPETAALEFGFPFDAARILWSQYLGNPGHANAELTVTAPNPLSTEFLPKSRVYNWPNPVYGRYTHIRYYVSEDADVTVTVFDLAGAKITELRGRGVKNMDNEIQWDVTNIQSGVYLARLQADSGARNEVAIIKIAVVK
jgi:hypothetical protein